MCFLCWVVFHSEICLTTLEYRTQTWKTIKSLLEITAGGEEKVRKKIYKALKAGCVEDARRGGRGSWESRQALWWRHPTYIMLQQSAQASCFPIGEQRVSRHQKIVIIGQAITTGATSIHCLSANLAGCRRGEGTACFPSQWSLCLLSSLSDFAPSLAAFTDWVGRERAQVLASQVIKEQNVYMDTIKSQGASSLKLELQNVIGG